VFALTGIHHINIDYCGCQIVPLSKTVQILRQGWFPATFIRPQTAFTFDCLSFFHELTLQGKVNLYDFYHTLLRVTDNANLSKTVVSYILLPSQKYHDSLFSVSVYRVPSRLSDVEKFIGFEACWARPRSVGYRGHGSRRIISGVSCLPTSRAQPS
jgi:CxC2 like cysteine cluster associated with KDZ transposases